MLKEAIYEFVAERDHVTFAELSQHIEGFVGGHYALEREPKVVLWAEMTEVAVDAMLALLAEGRLVVRSASWINYLADGSGVCMPWPNARPRAATSGRIGCPCACARPSKPTSPNRH